MLDIRALRQDPQSARARLKIKNFDFDVDCFKALEARRKVLQTETEQMQNARNSKSKAIGQAKAAEIGRAHV